MRHKAAGPDIVKAALDAFHDLQLFSDVSFYRLGGEKGFGPSSSLREPAELILHIIR